MSDSKSYGAGDNTPEQIGYKLFVDVAIAENMRVKDYLGGDKVPDRKWILDTYAECLRTVQSPGARR
jgi:hypothetical protein